MERKTIQARMQQRIDTLAAWEDANPVLLEGEMGIVSENTALYKVGDGVTPWKDLPFRGFAGSVTQEQGESTADVMSQAAVTAAIAGLKKKTLVNVVDSTADTDRSIRPNVYYRWGEPLTSLEITLEVPEDPAILNNYMFEFTAAQDGCALTVHSELKWAQGEVLQPEPGKTYQVSIIHGLAVFMSFE